MSLEVTSIFWSCGSLRYLLAECIKEGYEAESVHASPSKIEKSTYARVFPTAHSGNRCPISRQFTIKSITHKSVSFIVLACPHSPLSPKNT
ncbi:unnamed protein product [Protopolystoma xenopodis]|uniref:Uncharacterized protein n=1 Tax=Protopolystoma xenopodis TaxID=117903 RepID=A0A3S5B512_9PLAT|nr:unnamed protein product [Protopolystoma xenopodis]